MSDIFQRNFWICLPLLIALMVGFRIWTVKQAEYRYWCEGCHLELVTRISEPPHHTNYRTFWTHQGKRVILRTTHNSLRWGDAVKVQGVVVNNSYTGKLELEVDEITMLDGNMWWFDLLNTLLSWRLTLVNTYRITLSEPQASLLSGIVLGKGEKMPEGFYQALVHSGTVHVVAASGFNVTLVAHAVLHVLLIFVSRKVAVSLSIVAIGAYVVLAGAGPAVTRAGIMGIWAIAAGALGREYIALWGLYSSSVVMLLLWPWLWFDVSFQLSVSATTGLLLLSPLLFPETKCLRSGLHIMRLLMTDLRSTLAATLTTLPIVVIVFGRLSIISPLTNMLVLWLVPPLMVGGSVLALVGLMVPPLSWIVAWMLWPLLSLFIFIVEWSGSLFFASVEVTEANWWLGWGWWFCLSGLVLMRRRQAR
jgi:ComEC/Rec2-related protein